MWGWRRQQLPIWFGGYDSGEFYDESSSEEEERRDAFWPFSEIGASTDVLVPQGDICKEISNLLGKPIQKAQHSVSGKASALKGLPGLIVKGGADIALPIREENAVDITSQGAEISDKVWALPGERVTVKNAKWVKGVEQLCRSSADKMGFKNIALHPVLETVMLYGEGGYLERQQDTGGDRCVARLEVQLPSVFIGGDLLVYAEERTWQTKFTFGKEDGSAEFEPHFVAYASGAYHAVDKVESGYRLVVVYSICLPPGVPSLNGRSPAQLQRMQLAAAIKRMTSRQDAARVKGESATSASEGQSAAAATAKQILALTLSRLFARFGQDTRSVQALSGVDRDRFESLSAANALLPPAQQMKFYIARLRYRGFGGWSEQQVLQDALWFSLSGEMLGDFSPTSVKWTTAFSFLNPRNETFGQLWKQSDEYGLMEHARFAIVGWPISEDFKNALSFIGDAEAMAIALADDPVNITNLQEVLRYKTAQLSQEPSRAPYTNPNRRGAMYTSPRMPITLPLCQKLCRVIADSGDVALVESFFKTYYRLQRDKREMTPAVAGLVRKVGWEHVRSWFISAIDYAPLSERMGLDLALAEALTDDPIARKALTLSALEVARAVFQFNPTSVATSGDLSLLWKHVVACGEPQAFPELSRMFLDMAPTLTGPVVKVLSELVSAGSLPEHRSTLVSLAARRRDWLAAEIADISKPFSYEILQPDFPGAAEMVAFLRGPKSAFLIHGFTGIAQARIRVALLSKKIKGRFVMTAKGRGANAHVEVVKGGTERDVRSLKLPEYKAELARLEREVGSVTTGVKRPREESSNAIAIE